MVKVYWSLPKIKIHCVLPGWSLLEKLPHFWVSPAKNFKFFLSLTTSNTLFSTAYKKTPSFKWIYAVKKWAAISRHTWKTGPRTLRRPRTLWGARTLRGPSTLWGSRTLGGPRTPWGLEILWWSRKDPGIYKLGKVSWIPISFH